MMTLRFLIVFAYVMLASPWIVFALTGFWLFPLLGIVFLFVGIKLWPRAVADWNLDKR